MSKLVPVFLEVESRDELLLNLLGIIFSILEIALLSCTVEQLKQAVRHDDLFFEIKAFDRFCDFDKDVALYPHIVLCKFGTDRLSKLK